MILSVTTNPRQKMIEFLKKLFFSAPEKKEEKPQAVGFVLLEKHLEVIRMLGEAPLVNQYVYVTCYGNVTTNKGYSVNNKHFGVEYDLVIKDLLRKEYLERMTESMYSPTVKMSVMWRNDETG